MTILYQATFLLSVALFVIIITMYVFAVSLLGRAMEGAEKSKQKTKMDRKEAIKREIDSIIEIKEKDSFEESLSELGNKLKALREQDTKFKAKEAEIGRTPYFLTFKGGVLPPSIGLLFSMIFSAIAWDISSTGSISIEVPWLLWGFSAGAVLFSLYRICNSLLAIEKVAVTSEVEWTRKLVDAFKITQLELEEEKKPQANVVIKDIKLPINMKKDSTRNIHINANVAKGDYIENTKLFICMSPELDFEDENNVAILDKEHELAGYKFITKEWGYALWGVAFNVHTKIAALGTTGTFEIYCYIYGRGIAHRIKLAEVIVK